MFTSSISADVLKQLASGKDPVCGAEVSASQSFASATYQDKTYYFCSAKCKDAFDADPAKYTGSGDEHEGECC